MDQVLPMIALVISIVSLVVAYWYHSKSILAADALASKVKAEHEGRIATWLQGGVKEQWEPCATGYGSVLVIEPEPGHKIVVGYKPYS
jgi:hypothetical protein